MFTMSKEFLLFLNNNGDSRFGYYRSVAILPTTHQKGTKLWLPYEFIMDMSRTLILAERRNFQNEYADAIVKKFQMVINREELSHLPLVDIWRPYHGQQVTKSYRWDQCFPLELTLAEFQKQIRKIKLPSVTNTPLYEWYFDHHTLLKFFTDPRFQGFLEHSGFQASTDQMHLNLSA